MEVHVHRIILYFMKVTFKAGKCLKAALNTYVRIQTGGTVYTYSYRILKKNIIMLLRGRIQHTIRNH